MQSIQYIEREAGDIKEEKIPSGNLIKFIYQNPIGKISLHGLFKRKLLSNIGGLYLNREASKNRIETFIRDFDINMEDFIVPKEGFKHFNDFFYRKVKPDARPIQDGIVSPADGRVLVFPSISDTDTFFVKGSNFSLEKFLQDQELAKKYTKGSMAIIRLAPVDYHRFHFTYSGSANSTTKINGWYYSVNPIALRKNLQIFLENKREYCIIQTKDIGDILHMDIGATMTGSIIQTYDANTNVTKGQEKGYFAFGGSTIVLLFEPNTIQFSEDLIENTQNGYETLLKMGETIAIQQ